MTQQEIFDTVLHHLRKQGVASYAPVTKNCLYRGPNGAKCAVGCLIKDDEYSHQMEGYDVDMLIVYEMLPEPLIKHQKLLRLLQICHDNSLYYGLLKSWEKSMSEIAKKFGLEYSEANQ